MRKVVVTRRLPIDINEALSDFDVDANYTNEPISNTRLKHLTNDAEGIICMLDEKIDKNILESSPKLKVIANYGVGVNNIDLVAAKACGITICNTPDILTRSTAELGFALMMAAARRLSEGDRLTRLNIFPAWSSTLLSGTDLYGKTLGIFGMGEIGKAVAKMAIGFNMNIIFHNRRVPDAKNLLPNSNYVSFEELLSESDFIVITAPLTPETKHKFTAKEFIAMKKSSILVNIGRGPIINETDLVNALKTGVIAGAGLDVYEDEPIVNSELKTLENTILTPHIGSSTIETRKGMAKMCVDSVISVLKNNTKPHNTVNI